MMCLTKAFSATLAIALMASTAAAADTIASGKIKSINADNKSFVLTDSADKDFTFKFDDKLVVNHDGKETKSDLKAGTHVFIPRWEKQAAGAWQATVVVVGRDGITPPM